MRARKEKGAGATRRGIVAAGLILLLAACGGEELGAPVADPNRMGPGGKVIPIDTSRTIPSPSGVAIACPVGPGADCPDAELAGAPLIDASLQGANLVRSNLYGADLRLADLRNANLTNADLRKADLSGADLRNAILNDARLQFANLAQANLRGASIENDQFSRTILCATIMPDGRERNSAACKQIELLPYTPGEPAILSYSMPATAVGCQEPEDVVQLALSYETVEAKKVRMEVDGEPLDQDFATGTVEAIVDFTCDRTKHTYTLIATAGDAEATKSKAVTRAAG